MLRKYSKMIIALVLQIFLFSCIDLWALGISSELNNGIIMFEMQKYKKTNIFKEQINRKNIFKLYEDYKDNQLKNKVLYSDKNYKVEFYKHNFKGWAAFLIGENNNPIKFITKINGPGFSSTESMVQYDSDNYYVEGFEEGAINIRLKGVLGGGPGDEDYNKGIENYNEGRYIQSIENFKEAIRKEKAAGSWAIHLFKYYINLGCAYQANKNYEDFMVSFKEADIQLSRMSLFGKLNKKFFGDYGDFLTNCISLYCVLGKYEKALSYIKELEELVDEDYKISEIYSNKGLLYSMLGLHNKALENYNLFFEKNDKKDKNNENMIRAMVNRGEEYLEYMDMLDPESIKLLKSTEAVKKQNMNIFSLRERINPRICLTSMRHNNCGIHAMFGEENESGIIFARNAQQIREEYIRFLKSYNNVTEIPNEQIRNYVIESIMNEFSVWISDPVVASKNFVYEFYINSLETRENDNRMLWLQELAVLAILAGKTFHVIDSGNDREYQTVRLVRNLGCFRINRRLRNFFQTIPADIYICGNGNHFSRYDLNVQRARENRPVLIEKEQRQFNVDGVNLHNKREYDEAIKKYSEVIRKNRKYAGAYKNRGVANYKKGNYDDAIKDYNMAIKYYPCMKNSTKLDYSRTYYYRGDVYFGKGDYENAIKDYEKALWEMRDKQTEKYSSLRKKIKEQLKKLRQEKGGGEGYRQRAIEDFKSAIEVLEPTHEYYFAVLGNLNYAQKNYKDAILFYTKAIEKDMFNRSLYYLRGKAYIRLGEFKKAFVDFSEAVKEGSDFALAKKMLRQPVFIKYNFENLLKSNRLKNCKELVCSQEFHDFTAKYICGDFFEKDYETLIDKYIVNTFSRNSTFGLASRKKNIEEGWYSLDVLAMTIRLGLAMLGGFEQGIDTFYQPELMNMPKGFKDILWEEISSCIEMYEIRKMMKTKEKSYVVETILNKIMNLSQNKEISISTGWLRHSVYVSFIKSSPEYITIRIDNLGKGITGIPTEGFPGRHLQTSEGQYYPVLAKIKIENITKLKQYIENIITAEKSSFVKGYKLIYDENKERTLFDERINILNNGEYEHIEPFNPQSMGNCPINSYAIGARIRMGGINYDYFLRCIKEMLTYKVDSKPFNKGEAHALDLKNINPFNEEIRLMQNDLYSKQYDKVIQRGEYLLGRKFEHYKMDTVCLFLASAYKKKEQWDNVLKIAKRGLDEKGIYGANKIKLYIFNYIALFKLDKKINFSDVYFLIFEDEFRQLETYDLLEFIVNCNIMAFILEKLGKNNKNYVDKSKKAFELLIKKRLLFPLEAVTRTRDKLHLEGIVHQVLFILFKFFDEFMINKKMRVSFLRELLRQIDDFIYKRDGVQQLVFFHRILLKQAENIRSENQECLTVLRHIIKEEKKRLGIIEDNNEEIGRKKEKYLKKATVFINNKIESFFKGKIRLKIKNQEIIAEDIDGSLDKNIVNFIRNIHQNCYDKGVFTPVDCDEKNPYIINLVSKLESLGKTDKSNEVFYLYELFLLWSNPKYEKMWNYIEAVATFLAIKEKYRHLKLKNVSELQILIYTYLSYIKVTDDVDLSILTKGFNFLREDSDHKLLLDKCPVPGKENVYYEQIIFDFGDLLKKYNCIQNEELNFINIDTNVLKVLGEIFNKKNIKENLILDEQGCPIDFLGLEEYFSSFKDKVLFNDCKSDIERWLRVEECVGNYS